MGAGIHSLSVWDVLVNAILTAFYFINKLLMCILGLIPPLSPNTLTQ